VIVSANEYEVGDTLSKKNERRKERGEKVLLIYLKCLAPKKKFLSITKILN